MPTFLTPFTTSGNYTVSDPCCIKVVGGELINVAYTAATSLTMSSTAADRMTDTIKDLYRLPAFSFFCRVKWYNAPSGAEFVFDCRNTGNGGFTVFDNSGNWYAAVIDGGGTTRAVSAGTSAVANATWYDIWLACGSTTFKLYINGVQDGGTSTIVGGHGITGSVNPQWGAQASTPTNLHPDAYFHESGVVSRQLSDDEIAQHYNGGTPKDFRALSFVDDIEEWWLFGDGPEDSIDGSGNGTVKGVYGVADITCTGVPEAAQTPSSVTSYPTDNPWAYKTAGNTAAVISALTDITETLGVSNAGSWRCIMSKDASTWYYHNGGEFVIAGSDRGTYSNTFAELAAVIEEWDTSGGTFYVGFISVSDGTQSTNLDNVDIDYDVYTITFNVKDTDGNHLTGVLFDPDNGNVLSNETTSPFTQSYNTGTFDPKFAASGKLFHTEQITVTSDATVDVELSAGGLDEGTRNSILGINSRVRSLPTLIEILNGINTDNRLPSMARVAGLLSMNKGRK